MGGQPTACAKRELFEKAQITTGSFHLFGDFIPRYDGFEVVKRAFVPLSELKSKVMLLQNQAGDIIIQQIEKM